MSSAPSESVITTKQAARAVRWTAPLLLVLVAACEDVEIPPYSEVVAVDLPNAYWRMEEGTGTVAGDSSAFGRHGAYISNPTLGSNVGPRLGKGVTLSSTPDGVRIEHAVWMNMPALTVEAWVRPTQVTYPEAILLVDKGESWGLTIGADGKPAFALPGALVTGRATATTALLIGSLYHLVGTYQAGMLQLYVNGELAGQDPAGRPTLALTTQPMHIGRGLSLGRFDYVGAIDEVAVYDRVLTAARIKAHYEAGR
jgi:hypothetical protein